MNNIKDNDKKKNSSVDGTEGHYTAGTVRHDNHKLPMWFIKSRNATYYILGIIEALIAFRFVFKLLGANAQNGFVAFLYSMAGIFTAPFSGIFDPYVTAGLAAKSVLEPAALIAMAVYAILAWALVGFFRLIAVKEGY